MTQIRDVFRRVSAFFRAPCTLHFLPLEACRVGRVYRTRRRRRFGIPAFPYETNGMHKYFRRYSTERAEGGFSAATSACARRASVPNYRVGFMNTIAATARKLAWRHWLLLPLMNLCICIPRRCSARSTPQKKKKSRLLSARFLTLETSRLATPEGCRTAVIRTLVVSLLQVDRRETIASL